MHMHRATKPIVLAVSAFFGLGVVTAFAANTHGDAVSDLAHTSKLLVGAARGEAISALAKTNGRSDRTKAASATERDTQGDTVSAIAKRDTTAAHTTGDKAVNHGGAVSTAAHRK
jgi:hypothetical protein